MYTNSEMCSTVKFVACLLVWNCCCVWMQCVADRHAQTSGCLIRGLMKEVIDEVGHEIEEKERERETTFVCLHHLLSVHFLIVLFSRQWWTCVRKQVKLIFHM